jgi:hypothetical protein
MDPDADPDADPDLFVFIIDLQDADKKKTNSIKSLCLLFLHNF